MSNWRRVSLHMYNINCSTFKIHKKFGGSEATRAPLTASPIPTGAAIEMSFTKERVFLRAFSIRHFLWFHPSQSIPDGVLSEVFFHPQRGLQIVSIGRCGLARHSSGKRNTRIWLFYVLSYLHVYALVFSQFNNLICLLQRF